MNIVLIGFMCAGKSRVGRELAARLKWTFHDTDDMVEKAARARVGEIIRGKGEAAFRLLERDAVKHVAAFDNAVIATGGGAPLDPDNLADLERNGRLVWLRASPRAILRRAGDFSLRPLIDPSDPLGSVQKRLAEREPVYARASIVVDTDGLAPEAVADRVLALSKEPKK